MSSSHMYVFLTGESGVFYDLIQPVFKQCLNRNCADVTIYFQMCFINTETPKQEWPGIDPSTSSGFKTDRSTIEPSQLSSHHISF